MVRSTVAALLLAGAVVQSQPKAPSFLDAAAPSARLDTLHLQAQAEGPVQVGPDGRAVVTLLVTPRPKMHVYAPDVAGYVPFTVKLEPQAGIMAGKVSYPPSETYVFPPTGESSRAYMKPFRVTHVLTVAPDVRKKVAGGAPVDGALVLRYQACDDAVCYRPTTGSVAFSLAR